jgi:NADPH2:quinone reductase
MRTVVCPELGPLDNLVIEEREPPVAGEGQVVVQVRAAGVNYVDGLMCQGRYQIKPATPFVPGSELAGEVVSIGPGVTGVDPGVRVVVFTGLGAFAEQVVVPALSVLPMPDALTYAQAAALIQSYGTALFALTRRTSVAEGEHVLVLGAGGGVGLAVVDVARALGARVIAAASTEEKLEAARAMGARSTIAYEHEDLKVQARALSDGGVDVVVDPVGGAHSEPALRALRPFGRFCVIGFAAGPIPTIPLNQVLLNNRTVVGVDWGGGCSGTPTATTGAGPPGRPGGPGSAPPHRSHRVPVVRCGPSHVRPHRPITGGQGRAGAVTGASAKTW